MDDAVVDYLAETTGMPATRVAAELDLGERRRAFVLHELVDAGLNGTELVRVAMCLTGLDEQRVRDLLR